jgi:hypothetical protein
LSSQKSGEKGIIPGRRVHNCDHEPFITFIFASESKNVRASTAELVEMRLVLGYAFAVLLVSHRRRLSIAAAEYGSPPEIVGYAGAGVGLYDPRSARGRPLTAEDGARNREYVIDDGTRRGVERPTRHQPPGRWRSLRFVTSWRNTTKHLAEGFMTHS